MVLRLYHSLPGTYHNAASLVEHDDMNFHLWWNILIGRTSTAIGANEDAVPLYTSGTEDAARMLPGMLSSWPEQYCAMLNSSSVLLCNGSASLARGGSETVLKNTLKTFRLSHVCNVSVVSVTNKGAQEHLRVPDRVSDGVSRISYICLEYKVPGCLSSALCASVSDVSLCEARSAQL
jgi:hypothetical protein